MQHLLFVAAFAASVTACLSTWKVGPFPPPASAAYCQSDCDCYDKARPSRPGNICRFWAQDKPARCFPPGAGELNACDAVYPEQPPPPF